MHDLLNWDLIIIKLSVFTGQVKKIKQAPAYSLIRSKKPHQNSGHRKTQNLDFISGAASVALMLMVFLGTLYAQGKPTVAILDFEGQKVKTTDVQTLTERLRTEIGNTNAVRLIERKAVEKIMEEQGLQQTGCVSDECAAEVGQLLGVQFMVSGTIGKMGKTYTIDIKMFSVETGATERTKSATYKGDIDGLLVEMEILAWEIVGLDAPQRLKLKRSGEDKERPTVAILDFEGRGINILEAQTLTDRYGSEMNKTDRVRLVERTTMNEVLEEQGFEATGCVSDECAAEVGAMLGVQLMVSGAIGKIGDTYTIDVKMFTVATGEAETMKSVSYQGPIDGLITEVEILAWNTLGLSPPRKLLEKNRIGTSAYLAKTSKPKTRGGALMRSLFVPGFGQLYSGNKLFGFAFLGLEAGLIGMAAKSSGDYSTAKSDYDAQLVNYQSATDPTAIAEYKSLVESARASMNTANDQMTVFSVAAGGVWLVSAVHAYLTGPRMASKQKAPALRLAYDPVSRQTKIKWEIRI